MKLHPLIDPQSPHYQDEVGKSNIEEMEEKLTLREMIGFCKGNIFKYEYRKVKKGQKEKDIVKIQNYKNYLSILEKLSLIDDSILAKVAFSQRNIKYIYEV